VSHWGPGEVVPWTNFGNQCGQEVFTVDGKTTKLLSNCPYLGDDITACQETYGKKILLSLGGDGSPNYYFKDIASARYTADFLWGAFGPLTDEWETAGGPRPFGTAVVDGFDFDIESVRSVIPKDDDGNPIKNWASLGYANMVKYFRNTLFPKDTSKTYYLSGSPQCSYPDPHLNAAINQAHFDFLFIQFYNTPACSARAGVNHKKASQPDISFVQWAKALKGTGTKIFFGLPASSDAAPAFPNHYLAPKAVQTLLKRFMPNYSKQIGGISLWEATYARNNVICNAQYFHWMKKALERTVPGGVAARSDDMESFEEIDARATCNPWGKKKKSKRDASVYSAYQPQGYSYSPPTYGTTTSSAAAYETTPAAYSSYGAQTPSAYTTSSVSSPTYETTPLSEYETPSAYSPPPYNSISSTANATEYPATHSSYPTYTSSYGSATETPSAYSTTHKAYTPSVYSSVYTPETSSSTYSPSSYSSKSSTQSHYSVSTPNVYPTTSVSSVKHPHHGHKPETVYTTLVTTTYVDVCPTGLTTKTATYMSTHHPGASSPTTPPAGWTVTETVCTHCGPTPTHLTITHPVSYPTPEQTTTKHEESTTTITSTHWVQPSHSGSGLVSSETMSSSSESHSKHTLTRTHSLVVTSYTTAPPAPYTGTATVTSTSVAGTTTNVHYVTVPKPKSSSSSEHTTTTMVQVVYVTPVPAHSTLTSVPWQPYNNSTSEVVSPVSSSQPATSSISLPVVVTTYAPASSSVPSSAPSPYSMVSSSTPAPPVPTNAGGKLQSGLSLVLGAVAVAVMMI
jgi:chitinase